MVKILKTDLDFCYCFLRLFIIVYNEVFLNSIAMVTHYIQKIILNEFQKTNKRLTLAEIETRKRHFKCN